MRLSPKQLEFLAAAQRTAVLIGSMPATAWIAALIFAGGVSFGQVLVGIGIGVVIYFASYAVQKKNMPE